MAVGVTLLYAITFLVAYISPSKSVTVTINTIGEANIELVLLAIIVPISISALIIYLRKYLKRED